MSLYYINIFMSENIEYEKILYFIENDILNTRLINNSIIENELDGGTFVLNTFKKKEF